MLLAFLYSLLWLVVVDSWSLQGPTTNLRIRPFRSSSSPNTALRNVGDACGLEYEQPVFRPPAEWRSLILQVTIGCSWNQCTFCEMYQSKSFRAKPLDQIEQELQRVRQAGGAPHVRDVFLADGDAMALPAGKLMAILDLIHQYLPKVRRISSYCLPRNIRYTSVEYLTKLREKGLSLVYVGCESGDDQVLQAIQKGETYETSLIALQKLQQAGIKRSIMILLGLGGRALSESHAHASARLCSAAEPEYLSVLTTSFPRGQERVQEGYQKELGVEFQELDAREILRELERFLFQLDLPRNQTIFRSDHASNYLVLKGRLGREQGRMLEELRNVLDAHPDQDAYNLRPEWSRGL
jgi:radical SAM superfamily enzyme YgiQ (UPF0313 family)